MTVDDDEQEPQQETEDVWQYGDFSFSDAIDDAIDDATDASGTTDTTYGGGGLLQTILDEVTSLRDGTEADRIALADALTASFSKIEVEIEVLRDHVASLRAELDASNGVLASAMTQLIKAVGAETDVDVPAIVERVVAAQGEANVEAVVSALVPQLTALRKAVPTADTARIAVEVSRLRQSLIGS